MSKTATTPLQAADAQMKELLQVKAAELEKICNLKREAAAELRAASEAMEKATKELDSGAYEKAKAAAQRAEDKAGMIDARFSQVQRRELITEAESDEVIDSLLQYETDLSEGFRDAIAGPLEHLAELLAAYKKEIRAVETFISRWSADIHANHRTRGASLFFDENGGYTDRSTTPVPVHSQPYKGCTEAAVLLAALEKTGYRKGEPEG